MIALQRFGSCVDISGLCRLRFRFVGEVDSLGSLYCSASAEMQTTMSGYAAVCAVMKISVVILFILVTTVSYFVLKLDRGS